jgi:membrane-associated phospholipid phosphatase
MVPTALIIALWLYMAQGRSAAYLWVALFSLAGLLVIATKVAFIGYGLGVPRFNFTGISGHSMLSMAVLPVALLLMGGRVGPAFLGKRWLLVVLGAALALLIALSRVRIGYHSASEAITGAVLGAAVVGLFLFAAKLPAERMKSMPLLCAGLLAVFFAGYGNAAPTDDIVTRLALAASGRSTPYTRDDLFRPPVGSGSLFRALVASRL